MDQIASGTAGTKAARATLQVPAPTAWPIVLAFGIALLFAGLVTDAFVSILGAVLAVAGAIGWFCDVLPQQKEETVEVTEEAFVPTSLRRAVDRLPVAPELPRALLPLETYPVSAGIKGGLAGAAAMAILACSYGLLIKKSIWYPINLLAATVYSQELKFGTASLTQFNMESFLLAVLIHVLTSVLVGLLYGTMLPMFPRRPILLGGVIAPILWTGLLHSILGLLNPMLNQLISWPWFIASQFAFGIVAGLVVAQQERVHVRQLLPFMQRLGFEGPGFSEAKHRGDKVP
ncbi:MAG TPA: hypothetical protein VMG82_07990 [Candidatus Sulfotelmatobacter sp.]|nr:hypothetical protein [Candidatus Sulfotelmatobacter sp.]